MRNDTLQAIEKYSIKTFGSKKLIEKAEACIKPDEQIVFISPTNLVISDPGVRKKKQTPCIVVLTNQRIVFHLKIAFSSQTDVLKLDAIQSISSNSNGLTGSHIELHTTSRCYDILVTYKHDMLQKILNAFEQARSDYTSKLTVSNTSTKAPDVIEQIEKLSELNKKGIITDDEFTAKKSELLAKI